MTNIDKKAAKFGRWGLGIPRNIREGTDKYLELRNRSWDRKHLMFDRDLHLTTTPLHLQIWRKISSELFKVKLGINLAYRSSPSAYMPRKLMLQYKLSSIFKKPWIAAQLRDYISWYKNDKRKALRIIRLLNKKKAILLDLYDADDILQVVLSARKRGDGIYADVMPIWYKHVLLREMPAIVRKKMLLLRKGHKIKFNRSDFGDTVAYSPRMPLVYRPSIYNKPIASNADPFVPDMLYGAKDADGVAALLRGKDVWFTPHRDVLQGYAGKRGRPYIVTLNPDALAVAGYRSDGKPLLTPHIANDIYNTEMRSSILQGTYTGGRTAGRASWGDRPDYLAVAYLKPFRYGIENWRNTGLFRVFSRSKDSDTGWQLVLPIPVRDKYDHLRLD